MRLQECFRTIDPKIDICCSVDENLQQGIDYDGTLIDGGWVCSICHKNWIGRGKDEYLANPLETLTKYGTRELSVINAIIRGNRPHLERVGIALNIKDR